MGIDFNFQVPPVMKRYTCSVIAGNRQLKPYTNAHFGNAPQVFVSNTFPTMAKYFAVVIAALVATASCYPLQQAGKRRQDIGHGFDDCIGPVLRAGCDFGHGGGHHGDGGVGIGYGGEGYIGGHGGYAGIGGDHGDYHGEYHGDFHEAHDHTTYVHSHSPPVHIGPNAPPVHLGIHRAPIHIPPHVPQIHVNSHAPIRHIGPHSQYVHMPPSVPIVHAGPVAPPVHVSTPPNVYHQAPIVHHEPHVVGGECCDGETWGVGSDGHKKK